MTLFAVVTPHLAGGAIRALVRMKVAISEAFVVQKAKPPREEGACDAKDVTYYIRLERHKSMLEGEDLTRLAKKLRLLVGRAWLVAVAVVS